LQQTNGDDHKETTNLPLNVRTFSWRRVVVFFLWASAWALYVLILCAISLKEYSGLGEMFKRTYGFILSVEDLSPNIGVMWYFFAEVFDFFRNFFLIVFHINIFFMVLPLAIRLYHRPCFLAFVYIAIVSILKSYPSVGDSALYLGLLALFVNALADMQFSFFLFSGYLGTLLLSPVMHNLWIWRGTGNANFYFATAMAYACFQIILVVESVSSMLNHDRALKRGTATVEKKILGESMEEPLGSSDVDFEADNQILSVYGTWLCWAIHLPKNAMFHERTKNITVRYHFIREIMESKEIEVAKIGTKDNAADAFTNVVLALFRNVLSLLELQAMS
ncbi:phosphatidylinositol glycan anchor biosynthesis class U protein isoform X1, partial [Tanacetum coccineum]